MEIQLAPSWVLTTNHAASSYGQPVLVKLATNEAYGPTDIVKAYESWGFAPAREVVRRLAEMITLTTNERMEVVKFIN